MITFKLHSPHQTCGWRAPWITRDYWVAHTLGEEMTGAGGRIVYGDADIDVYLWGFIKEDINPHHNNVLWIIGHPGNMLDLLKGKPGIIGSYFSSVFCASKKFCERLQNEFALDARHLVLPSPARPSLELEYDPEYDIAFIGNADPKKGRHKLVPLLKEFKSVVYGDMWDKLLPWTVWHGQYIPWDKLSSVWNSARIIPYSTHDDMRQEGFVADSCLDAMVNSRALVLPDRNPGFENLGIDTPQWGSEVELRELVEYYMSEPLQRERLARSQNEAASVFTYKHAARVLLSCT